MKEKILNSKGISLIALSIAVMIILVITGTIIYNVKDNLKVERLEQMQQDIENLRGKIDTYYAQYGKIPAKFDAEYTNVTGMQDAGVISEAVDIGKFYVIDLEAIENLTLSYGQDYENVKVLIDSEKISEYTNLYIINEASHNVFYPAGIELDGEMFYTNYTSEDIDTESVKLHYADNIKIPDGYKYISGKKDSGIIIEDETTGEQYKWIVVNSEITELPEGVTVENEVEFLNNVNLLDGYYQAVDDEAIVMVLPIEEKWSPIYDKNGKYVDKNLDEAIIPAGFKVSRTPGMDTISEGLVIQDEEQNEFVWIPVTSESQYVRNITYDYSMLSEAAYTDSGYLPDGIQPPIEDGKTDEEIAIINEEAEKQAVLSAGGFYISRYEAGDSLATDYRDTETEGTLVCKNNVYPYSYITQEDAKTKAKTFINNDNVKSALISGIQWDVTMATIDQKKDGNGEIYDVRTYLGDRHTGEITTTGQNIADKVYNIYDLEGNFYEYVAERNNLDKYYTYILRGGCFFYSNPYSRIISESLPASDRGSNLGGCGTYDAFRIVLYVCENNIKV